MLEKTSLINIISPYSIFNKWGRGESEYGK